MFPNRIVDLLPRKVLRSFDFGKFEDTDYNRQQHQGDADHRVWHLDRGRLLHAVRMQRLRRELPYLFDRQWRGAQDQQPSDFWSDGGTERVESLRQIQAT